MVELENARGMSLAPKLQDENSMRAEFRVLETHIHLVYTLLRDAEFHTESLYSQGVEKTSEMALDPSCQASQDGAGEAAPLSSEAAGPEISAASVHSNGMI